MVANVVVVLFGIYCTCEIDLALGTKKATEWGCMRDQMTASLVVYNE